jgi:hypothetical protein
MQLGCWNTVANPPRDSDRQEVAPEIFSVVNPMENISWARTTFLGARIAHGT